MLAKLPEIDYDNLSSLARVVMTMDQYDEIRELREGVYLGGFNMNHVIEDHILHEYPFSPWMWTEYRNLDYTARMDMILSTDDRPSDYGVCDFYDQILAKWPIIEESERKFIITLAPVRRVEQPETGGWRWHKWGMYIGLQKVDSEYIYDCKDVSVVYCFRIYEIK